MTFFWMSVVKGSCTAEEFRVSLEKKKTNMEKYLLFSRNIFKKYFVPLENSRDIIWKF